MSESLIQVLLVGIVTFGVVYITVPVLIKVAYLRDLYDKPDGDRKLHNGYIPTLGGIAIFLAFFVGFSITGVADRFFGYPYFAAAMIILFFTGMKDDLIGLSPVKKLIAELVAVCLLFFGSEVAISSFHGVFGIYELPLIVSFLITLFTMIVVVNAYNLIDGVDGLAAGIGTIASLFFGFGFLVAGVPEMAAMSFILAVSLVGFLVFNFKPASIFMGDTGSIIVGFLLSVLAIEFIGLNDLPAYVEMFSFTSPVLPVAFLIVPLYDTIRVFYRRAKRKTSPFLPGKDHIHHELMRMGYGHKGTALILYGSSILVSVIAFSVSSLDVHFVLAITLCASVLVFPTNGTKRRLLSKMGIDLHVGPSYFENMEVKNEEAEKAPKKTASEVA